MNWNDFLIGVKVGMGMKIKNNLANDRRRKRCI